MARGDHYNTTNKGNTHNLTPQHCIQGIDVQTATIQDEDELCGAVVLSELLICLLDIVTRSRAESDQVGALRRAIAMVSTLSADHITHMRLSGIKTNLLLNICELGDNKAHCYCCSPSIILQIFFNEFNDIFSLLPGCVTYRPPESLCGESGDSWSVFYLETGECVRMRLD